MNLGSFMQTKHLCVLIHIQTKGEVGEPGNRLKPSSNYILLTVPRRYFFCVSFYYLCLVSVMLSRLFSAALWSPDWKGLTSWLSCVWFYCVFVISYVVFWARCGAWLYRFLIFAFFHTFIHCCWGIPRIWIQLFFSTLLLVKYSDFPMLSKYLSQEKTFIWTNLIRPIYATLHSNDQSNRRIIVKDYWSCHLGNVTRIFYSRTPDWDFRCFTSPWER